MTDAKAVLRIEPEADLLRALLFAQQGLDSLPDRLPDARTDLVPPSGESQRMGLFGSVVPPPTVSLKFPADRGLMNPHDSGDLGLVCSGFHQGGNLITLFPGKLRATSHLRSSFLAE